MRLSAPTVRKAANKTALVVYYSTGFFLREAERVFEREPKQGYLSENEFSTRALPFCKVGWLCCSGDRYFTRSRISKDIGNLILCKKRSFARIFIFPTVKTVELNCV